MTMISYAQNGEDVMLMRALGNIAGGFYIDVGAADPTILSVTRAFYERGWHGVNIEPTEDRHRLLNEARPRDVNLSQPVSDRMAEEMFHVCEQYPDLSTLHEDVAAATCSGGLRIQSRIVQTTTLAEVCRRFAPLVIHFLKIDVEGAEESVLRGADFQRYRPWIVVVEATRPGTQIPAYVSWEPVLLDNQYRFVWFDGLNRFYLAGEKFDSLRHHFDTPLNVFDQYVCYDITSETLAAEAAATKTELELLRAAVVAAEHRADAAVSDIRTLAEVAERERAAAVSRADAADAMAALLDARMRSSDALAQAAAVNAHAAEAQVSAARTRLSDLQHEIDDTRRRNEDLHRHEEATRAVLAAQQSEAAAQLALAHRSLDDRAAVHDVACAERDSERARAQALDVHAEALRREVSALAAELAARPAPPREPAVQAVETVPSPMAVSPRPPLRRRVAARLYAWTLRPVLRPLAWRGRGFLLAGFAQALDERGSWVGTPSPNAGAQTALLGQIRGRQDRILEMVHRVDDLAAEQRAQHFHDIADLRTRADDAIAAARRIEAALSQHTDSDLEGLARSMEAALLTLATAGRARGR
ncbi:MAG: FkbM family methyltransferase [Janthinobacterium lividum]